MSNSRLSQTVPYPGDGGSTDSTEVLLKINACSIALCAVASAATAAHVKSVATAPAGSVQAGRKAVTAAPVDSPGTLPAGGDESFRFRMLSWSTAPALPLSSGEEVGTVGRPARLAISSPFGWRADPIQGIKRRHDGVDLPGATGTPIFATGAGRVWIAGWVRGYGNLVEILHPGGIATRYGHLSRIRVGRGEAVDQGQLIGAMGSTGHSTGPHLHYEVRLNGAPVDPLSYMGQKAPRYRVDWAREVTVAPKWVGWKHVETADRLPEAEIR